MSKRARSQSPAVFTYGRFNPPTAGHESMIQNMVNYANRQQIKPRVYVVVSHSVKPPKKNPLNANKKIEILKKMFPNSGITFLKSEPGKMMLKDIPEYLRKEEGHDNVTMIAGSDRVESGNFNWMPVPVMTVSAPRTKNLNVVGPTSVSATRARECARGNWKGFVRCMSRMLPKENLENLRNLIRQKMGS